MKKEKNVWNMGIGEFQEEFTRTLFSKRGLVAAPVALAVGLPIAAVSGVPLVGAIAGMGVALSLCRKRNDRPGNAKKSEPK